MSLFYLTLTYELAMDLPDQLPPARLYWNADEAEKLTCSRCVELAFSRPVGIRADFLPVRCWRHRLSDEPTVGWAYITTMETTILNILRQHGWTEEILARLQEEVLRVETEAMTARFERVHTNEQPSTHARLALQLAVQAPLAAEIPKPAPVEAPVATKTIDALNDGYSSSDVASGYSDSD